ncbi:PREDICTED: uncharacterized protein LOC105570452 [Vollenhovia emeryi]|uniref:uncharacterized protein LOC105570452 n=1 Tax=Vollenhovia emeryi TaxID=411798 RepID=UPI0005F458DE|nr:PREDICTED: uncharacterized protein LOC105570452 [Vollenhovia emeryi]
MSLAMIQRLVISGCRGVRIDIDRTVAPCLSALLGRTAATWTTFPRAVPRRPLHDSAIRSERVNPRENGCGVADDISAFQLKKRPSRRSRSVISDRISQSDGWTVKALTTAEEYNLEALAYGLLDQQLYVPSKISTSANRRINPEFAK